MSSTNWTILSSNKVHINKNKDVILHTKCLISREAHISDAVSEACVAGHAFKEGQSAFATERLKQ